MRIAFAGTPHFAVPSLRRLIESGAEIVLVYTQPDRPSGRGRKLTHSAVKTLALEHGLPLAQPSTLKDPEVVAELTALAPDVMVVAAYGLMLPGAILRTPKFGCLNVHASLLPRWRGAAPVARAIEAGDTRTGVTIMLMDAGLDTGAIVDQRATDIEAHDNADTLLDKLAQLGADLLLECLPDYVSGESAAVAQEDGDAVYAAKLSKSEGLIDWSRSAHEIHNKIRAFNPWPVAYTHHNGNRIRVLEAVVPDSRVARSLMPGTITESGKNGIDVACAAGVLRLTVLQKEHGRPLNVRDFVNGYAIDRGDVFE